MKRVWFAILISCIFASCADVTEEADPNQGNVGLIRLSKEEVMSIAFDEPRILSEDSVVSLTNVFCRSFYPQHQVVSTRGGSAIAKKQYLKYEQSFTRGSVKQDSIALYTVLISNGNDTGYALVSADDRSSGVIACVPKGNPDSINNSNAEMMAKLSEISVLSEVAKIERMKATKRSETLEKIAKLCGKDSVTYDEVKNRVCQIANGIHSEAFDSPHGTIEGIIPPVTKTTWSQKEPYSNYLPKSYHPSTGMLTHYPAGCAIVAGVQALAAVAPDLTINGVNIDWEYLTKEPKVNYNSYTGGDEKGMNMVATVVKDMYEKTATVPNIDPNYEYSQYDDPNIPCVLSSSTDVLKLKQYLEKYVSCGKYYDKYVADPLFLSINANQKLPCVAIMGAKNKDGGSHAWIIDGCAICSKTAREILRHSDLYFHANMGWGGNGDGFYKVNADTTIDFETIQGTYNIDFWEITEVHRK